jgi:2'-5' RNA ligase
MARVRTFIGIGIGDAIRARSVALQQEVSRAVAGVRWEEPGNFHITLVFLGDVSDRELPAVCRAAMDVAAGEPPIPLEVSGIGAFPSVRRPRTIWAGVTTGAEVLVRLHDKLEERLEDLRIYQREERPYTPHLTLGRVRDESVGHGLAGILPRHRDWNGGQELIEEVRVYASEPGRDGPVYTVLGRGELRGPRAADEVSERP